jgi:hypothetical protein
MYVHVFECVVMKVSGWIKSELSYYKVYHKFGIRNHLYMSTLDALSVLNTYNSIAEHPCCFSHKLSGMEQP